MGVNVDGHFYAIFVLVQYIDTGNGIVIKTRDYAFTYDDCLARGEIELEVRPGAVLACVVQTTPPPPPIERDAIGVVPALVMIVMAGLFAVIKFCR